MKYRVYYIETGDEATVKRTDDLKEAAYAYYRVLYSGTYPRLSVDGRQLHIEQADKLCLSVYKDKTGHAVQHEVWRDFGIRGPV